jgi:hypothetical protein
MKNERKVQKKMRVVGKKRKSGVKEEATLFLWLL